MRGWQARRAEVDQRLAPYFRQPKARQRTAAYMDDLLGDAQLKGSLLQQQVMDGVARADSAVFLAKGYVHDPVVGIFDRKLHTWLTEVSTSGQSHFIG